MFRFTNCICMYTNMRFKSLGLGRREKDANSQRQTLDKSPLLLCLCLPQNNKILFKDNICRKKVQYYKNICLHGHLHNYYQKVVIQATVISAHLATFEARGYRTEAISCIKLVNICSRTNTKWQSREIWQVLRGERPLSLTMHLYTAKSLSPS